MKCIKAGSGGYLLENSLPLLFGRCGVCRIVEGEGEHQ
ncbi:hypothetical protein KNP414_05720 [Paenibacillus mucilaginosus KNP414]|uniref:Uncharacterized protein n=1 Tax=Paenibacillus mucilaginosus (strain KNP414) TaxID=1036673 RepID=F8FMS3_PAEMK|nr:hypothetical protein KNP414_05720 [Paenibacillus mucilaginosus KNP414]